MSNEIENMIAASGKKAPRITPDDIKAKIAGEYFHIPPNTTLTICVLKLANGFTVTGESACASPENFDKEIGETIARKNAVEKIWMLEGYLLCEKLHNGPRLASKSFPFPLPSVVVQPHDEMEQFIGTKIVNAQPMTRAEYTLFRGWTLPADENGTDAGYLVEYTDAQRPNVEGFAGYVTWSPKDVFDGAYRPTHDDSPVVPAELGEVHEIGSETDTTLHFDV